MTRPIDANDEAEATVSAGCHAGLSVLDHHAAIRRDLQPTRRFQENGRVWLTGEAELSRDDPVDANRKQILDAGRCQHAFAVQTRRVHRRSQSRFNRRTSATVESNTGTPSASNGRNRSWLRLPSPQTVSAIASSAGEP